MTLDGPEKNIKEKLPKKSSPKVIFARYADDFIIKAKSKEPLENEVLPVIETLLQDGGLDLPKGKTKIIHINEGLDFLGQSLRRFKGKTTYST